MSRRVSCIAFLLLAAPTAGCGGAAPPATKSAAPALNVDELSAELEAAERQLYQELGAPSGAALGRKKPDEGASVAPEEEEAPDAEAKPEQPTSQPSTGGDQRQPSDCATACKALESMKRSAARICDIAGEAHERCVWANARVAEATKRVEQAGCACSPD